MNIAAILLVFAGLGGEAHGPISLDPLLTKLRDAERIEVRFDPEIAKTESHTYTDIGGFLARIIEEDVSAHPTDGDIDRPKEIHIIGYRERSDNDSFFKAAITADRLRFEHNGRMYEAELDLSELYRRLPQKDLGLSPPGAERTPAAPMPLGKVIDQWKRAERLVIKMHAAEKLPSGQPGRERTTSYTITDRDLINHLAGLADEKLVLRNTLPWGAVPGGSIIVGFKNPRLFIIGYDKKGDEKSSFRISMVFGKKWMYSHDDYIYEATIASDELYRRLVDKNFDFSKSSGKKSGKNP